MSDNKKKRTWPCIFAGCGLVVLMLLVIGGVFLYAGWQGYQESAKIIEVQDREPQLEDPYSLSSDQNDSLISYGYPEAFTILFYEEERPGGGTQTIRLETWDYYTQGLGLTYINGVLEGKDPIEIGDISTVAPLPYFPEQFAAYMSLEEVISAAGIDTYVEIPLENEFMQEGVLYYANSLSFGLKDDQLIYIEAIALTNE